MFGHDPTIYIQNERKRKEMKNWFAPSALLQFWEDAVTNANQFNAADNDKKFSLSLMASIYFDDYRDVEIVSQGIKNTMKTSRSLGKKLHMPSISEFLEDVAMNQEEYSKGRTPTDLHGKMRLNAVLYLSAMVTVLGKETSDTLVGTLESIVLYEDMDLVALIAAGILKDLGIIDDATTYYLSKRYLSDDREPELRVSKGGVIKLRP